MRNKIQKTLFTWFALTLTTTTTRIAHLANRSPLVAAFCPRHSLSQRLSATRAAFPVHRDNGIAVPRWTPPGSTVVRGATHQNRENLLEGCVESLRECLLVVPRFCVDRWMEAEQEAIARCGHIRNPEKREAAIEKYMVTWWQTRCFWLVAMASLVISTAVVRWETRENDAVLEIASLAFFQ